MRFIIGPRGPASLCRSFAFSQSEKLHVMKNYFLCRATEADEACVAAGPVWLSTASNCGDFLPNAWTGGLSAWALNFQQNN